MNVRELLSYNIERIRIAKKLTKAELAKRSGYTRKHIGNVTMGYVYPKEAFLLALAKALEVDVSELFIAPDYREKRIDEVFKAFAETERKIAEESKTKKEEEILNILKEKL
ncbi:MAG: helix-turn-helix domain-containing protein [Spirochaetales bacterium]|nr:helix-turn-helix domain-containing protein [Candidatus Physcosoma equi]